MTKHSALKHPALKHLFLVPLLFFFAMNIVSAQDLSKKTFKGLPLSKPFSQVLGEPAPGTQILVWGSKGSGKSTFTTSLLTDLADYAPALLVQAEEGISKTTQDRLRLVGADQHPNLLVASYTDMSAVQYAIEEHGILFLCFDSISRMPVGTEDIGHFLSFCRERLITLITVGHALKGAKDYKGPTEWGHDVDVILRIEGGKVYSEKNRVHGTPEVIDVPFAPVRHRKKPSPEPIFQASRKAVRDNPVRTNPTIRGNPTIPVRKIDDTGENSPGRLDEAWEGRRITVSWPVYEWHKDPEAGRARFGLRGIEFGRWMTAEDRTRFLSGTMQALDDMAVVLGVQPAEIGHREVLALALGARGRGGGAAAHYEPDTHTINLTRPHGHRSLCHEYGHALDRQAAWLDGTAGFASQMRRGSVGISGYAVQALDQVKYEEGDPDAEKTDWYQSLLDKGTPYYKSTAEVFARLFEKWIYSRLPEDGRKGKWLVHTKSRYAHYVYPTDELVALASPHLETFVKVVFKGLRERDGVYEPEEEFASHNDYLRSVARTSTSAIEIAGAWLEAARHRKVPGPVPATIAGFFNDGGRLSTRSYDRFGDPGRRKDDRTITLRYLKKDGVDADVLAQQLTGELDAVGHSLTITPGDIIDFIDTYPKGLGEYVRAHVNEHEEELADRYKRLTGRTISEPEALRMMSSMLASEDADSPSSDEEEDIFTGVPFDRVRLNPEPAVVYLGQMVKLTIRGAKRYEAISADKQGQPFLFWQPQTKDLFIVDRGLCEATHESVDARAKQEYERFHGFAADDLNYRISLPSSWEMIGTATRIWYLSDKIIRRGDRKGKLSGYKHRFDPLKRTIEVGTLDGHTALIVRGVEVDARGILT